MSKRVVYVINPLLFVSQSVGGTGIERVIRATES